MGNIMNRETGSTQDLNNEKFSVMINSSQMTITQLTSKCIYMHTVNKIATVPTAQRCSEQNLEPEQNKDSYHFDWNNLHATQKKYDRFMNTCPSMQASKQCTLLQ